MLSGKRFFILAICQFPFSQQAEQKNITNVLFIFQFQPTYLEPPSISKVFFSYNRSIYTFVEISPSKETINIRI